MGRADAYHVKPADMVRKEVNAADHVHELLSSTLVNKK